MENASRALIMASSVLIGVITLTIAVTLFRTFSNFSNSTYQKVEQARINEWNNEYLKFYGTMSKDIVDSTTGKPTGRSVTVPIPVTVHDIITIANNARQNNIDYGLYDPNDKTTIQEHNNNSFYVQVEVKNSGFGNDNSKHFEALSEKNKDTFLSNSLIDADISGKPIMLTKYYKVYRCEINPSTKRVNRICFEEFSRDNYGDYYKNFTTEYFYIDNTNFKIN